MSETEDFKSARRRVVNALDVGQFGGGALGEAWDTVARNLKDPNTDWKAKRAVVITIELTNADEDRERLLVESRALPKLAPRKVLKTKMVLENGGGDTPLLREYGNKAPTGPVVIMEQASPSGFNQHRKN